MKLSDFDYNLPKELIAQTPTKPRDHSRLLVLDRKDKGHGQDSKIKINIEHRNFFEIGEYLQKGDVLILNDSKVFPARLIGKKADTGGKIEIFLLRISDSAVSQIEKKKELWNCLIGGKIRREGQIVEFTRGLEATIMEDNKDGTWLVGFNKKGKTLMDIVDKIGEVPLPPYIKNTKNSKNNYQTVYADAKKVGSVAAPTAGLHFTPALMRRLKAKGVQFEYVTLHVGLGTFAPVKVDDITKHKMHAEWVEVKAATIKRIIKAKSEGRRVIGVGTTSVRTVEAVAAELRIKNYELRMNKDNHQRAGEIKVGNFFGWVNIYIFPGYKFNIIDGMITNFHLPKSTLIMLISALAGKKNIMQAYEEAVRKKYRFFSYGDAMLIL